MLRGIIARAAVGSSFPQSQATKDKNASGGNNKNASAIPNGRSNVGGAIRQSRPGSSNSSSQPNESPAPSRTEMDVTTPEGLLLTLISQYAGAARPAVVLMMLEAQAANNKVHNLYVYYTWNLHVVHNPYVKYMMEVLSC